jgi:hypothetical protein
MVTARSDVGVDLGGSKRRGGVLPHSGQLTTRLERETEAGRGPVDLLADVRGLIPRVTERVQVHVMLGVVAGRLCPMP